MALTNFPNGISSFGIPQIGSGIPASAGTYYFVDYTNGSDGNTGTSTTRPFKTIAKAYDVMEDGADDVCVLMGSATHVLTEMLTVSKNRVHFIGMDGTFGRPYGQNAKVSLGVTTAATDIATMKNTGIRNSFTNIKFINNNTVTEGIYCVVEGGEYALYTNCEIYKSTDLDVTGSAELVNNGDSAVFLGCTIGSLADTRVGAIIRANVLLTAGIAGVGKVCRDGTFQNCNFWIQAANAANRFVYAANATDVERTLMFKNCAFINNPAGAGTPAQAIAAGASLTVGAIVLDPLCFATKVTKVSTTTGVVVSGPAPSSGAGISVNAA